MGYQGSMNKTNVPKQYGPEPTTTCLSSGEVSSATKKPEQWEKIQFHLKLLNSSSSKSIDGGLLSESRSH